MQRGVPSEPHLITFDMCLTSECTLSVDKLFQSYNRATERSLSHKSRMSACFDPQAPDRYPRTLGLSVESRLLPSRLEGEIIADAFDGTVVDR